MPCQVAPPAWEGGSLLQTPNHVRLVQTSSCRGYCQRLRPSRWGVQGWAAVGAGEQGSGGERHPEEAWGSWWAVSRGKVGRMGSGAIIGPDDFSSAKPNQGCRGGVVAGRDRCPGAGLIPRLKLVPFSRDGQCGEEEGQQRGLPTLPTSRTWTETEQQGKQGRPAAELPRQAAGPQLAPSTQRLLTRRSPTAS